MNDVLYELIETVRTVAPKVWTIYVRQAYVDAIINVAFTVALLIASYYFYVAAKDSVRKEYDDVITAVTAIMSFVALVVAIVAFADAMSGFMNPEYAAIQLLLNSGQ